MSDAHLIDRDSFRFGRANSRADIEFLEDRHKGDKQGEGYSRWLQHCHGCEFEMLSATGNADGRRWSHASAAEYQWSDAVTPACRCHACLLLMLLDMQGDAPENAPLFRQMTTDGKWSWHGWQCGIASHFSSERLQYGRFNELLHEILHPDWLGHVKVLGPPELVNELNEFLKLTKEKNGLS